MPSTTTTMGTASAHKCAWATLVTNDDMYVLGAQVLAHSLHRTNTKYPFIIMHTSNISEASLERMRTSAPNVELRLVESIWSEVATATAPADAHMRTTRPTDLFRGESRGYVNAIYLECWTKLRLWQYTEYERVCFLDADMLVVKPMDELLDHVALQWDEVAAAPACRCNPAQKDSYPKTWTRNVCDHVRHQGDLQRMHLPVDQIVQAGPSATREYYFNAGMFVLVPSEATFRMLLAAIRALPDPTIFPFAEQDFLNEQFAGRIHRLPYSYNALKTLRTAHSEVWCDRDVRNIHFILAKPWNGRVTPEGDRQYSDMNELWWAAHDAMVRRRGAVVVGKPLAEKRQPLVIDAGVLDIDVDTPAVVRASLGGM